MSKTIPIWTCILNRAILNYRRRLEKYNSPKNESDTSNELGNLGQQSSDCSLHLPLWVSEMEKAMIEKRLDGWNKELEASGADITSIALSLRKPLRPLWISQKTVIWLNEVPDHDSWDFTPIILVSASTTSCAFQQRTTSEFSWNYIAGAGDDEESWARGLLPDLFWKQAYDIISSDPDLCNQKIANIIEEDRVRRAYKGENAPQVSVRALKCPGNAHMSPIREGEPVELENGSVAEGEKSKTNDCISFLGSTNIAVCKFQLEMEVPPAYCILNCGSESLPVSSNPEMYLHLPILDSKIDRFSLSRNIPSALNYAQCQLREGKTLLICCSNGEDISICISVAILLSFYDEGGNFDDGRSFRERQITKLDLRRRLIFICKYAVNARPSRGNLKQVYSCLSGGYVPSHV